MRVSVGSVALLLSLVVPASADVCTLGPLSAYEALGDTGCEIGPLIFKHFTFLTLSAEGGAVPIDSSAITITPADLGNDTFLGFSSTGFSVTGTEHVRYILTYTIDPPPIIFRARQEMVTSTPVAPGRAQIDTVGCATTATSCPPGTFFQMQVFHAGTTSQLTDEATFPLSSLVRMEHIIDLNANGASADFDAMNNSWTYVPEPASMVLAGVGLLALGLTQRWLLHR